MRLAIFLCCLLFTMFAQAQEVRDLVLDIKTKEVMDVFRDKKDEATKTKAIMEFIKSLKPVCLKVAKVKWNQIAPAELKRMDKDVGVFIGGMSDFQIKLRSDDNATLSSSDVTEIRRICRQFEKHSFN